MFISVCVHNDYVKIQIAGQNKRKRISTGIKVENSECLTKNGRLKSYVPENEIKNKKIELIKEQFENIRKDFIQKNNKEISVEELIGLYQNPQLLDSNKTNKKNQLLDYYEEFYNLKSEKLTLENGYEPDSIKEYRGLLYYLKDYEIFTEKEILLEDVSYDWLVRFKIFNLTKREITEKKQYNTLGGIRSNTLKKKINLFITFLRWLEEKSKGQFKFPNSLVEFSKNEIKSPKIIKDSLTKEEVNLILSANCCDDKERFIRDVFVFSCCTGLRWSDIVSIEKKDIKINKNGDFFIKKYAKKTDEEFHIFLNQTAKNILEYHNYKLDLLENANFNKYLKLFLKKFEVFQETTNFIEIEPKTKKSRNLMRYEVISIHRGRDTFINLLLNSNVPINTIMKYTGHKSISSLQKYIDQNKPVENYLNNII